MALTLPYPDMDFTPLDVLTAAEMDQIVSNYEYIANQFPVTSSNIDWATISYTPNSSATNQAVSGGMFFGKLVVLSIQCELAQNFGTTAFFPIGTIPRNFWPTMNILGTIRTSTAVTGTFIIDTYGNVAVRGSSGTLPSGLGIGFSTSWVK